MIFNKEKGYFWLNIIVLVLLVLGLMFVCKKTSSTQELIDGIEAIDSTNTYTKVYYDTEISNLKKKNKANRRRMKKKRKRNKE